jgi:hypothetical protein
MPNAYPLALFSVYQVSKAKGAFSSASTAHVTCLTILCHGCCCCTGGGCGVGLGLGWGFGAAWGSKYIIIESEFESGQEQGKPRWLAQLQQQLRIQKFEKNHQP